MLLVAAPLTPRAWLRRLDFALAAQPGAVPGDLTCPDCGGALNDTTSAALLWCDGCRRVYLLAARRAVCTVPDHWSEDRLFDFWERAMEGRLGCEDDMAFARHICRRAGAALTILEQPLTPKPDQVRIGRIALAHGLLTRSDVAWVLRFQRSARAHRRRCFGEIATALRLWRPNVVARLLAAQAERRRGVGAAIAERLNLSHQQTLAIEREFFGLDPDRPCESADSPFDAMMAA